MATPTYDLLDSTTLASSASSVSFTSIDQSYGDLVLVTESTHSTPADPYIQFNSDTGSNYNDVTMGGSGSATQSASRSSTTQIRVNAYADLGYGANLIIVQIMDYSATDKHKSVLTRNSVADRGVDAVASRWASTSAITSIKFYANTGTFDSGSTFYLYGIAKTVV